MPALARVNRFRRRAINAWRIASGLSDKRRALPRAGVFELLRAATPLAGVEHNGVQYVLRTGDRGVSRATYMTGNYELAQMEDAIARLTRIVGHDPLAGKVFVDVGANIGTASIPAVRHFGASRAIAFEAAEENFRILSANVALNGLEDRVAVRHVGVSDAHGFAELELASRNSGDNRIRTSAAAETFDAYHESRRPTTSVELVRLDDALEELGVGSADIGLVWVDTQGHEAHVLAGASRIIAAGVPIICEFWPYGLRRAGALEMFQEIVASSFTQVVDARNDEALPSARVGELAVRYGGERYSDLILLP